LTPEQILQYCQEESNTGETTRDKLIALHGYFENYRKQLQSVNMAASGRLFRSFRNGRYISTPLGKNTLAKVACKIATYLKLENPETFTGHTWRRSAATAFAESGASNQQMKRLGGWKSDSVVDGYVANSKKLKEIIAQGLLPEKQVEINGVEEEVEEETEKPPKKAKISDYDNEEITSFQIPGFQGCKIVNITFNIGKLSDM